MRNVQYFTQPNTSFSSDNGNISIGLHNDPKKPKKFEARHIRDPMKLKSKNWIFVHSQSYDERDIDNGLKNLKKSTNVYGIDVDYPELLVLKK